MELNVGVILKEGHHVVTLSNTGGGGLDTPTREYLRGKYHCTINLLFDWFGLVCFANKYKNCQ